MLNYFTCSHCLQVEADFNERWQAGSVPGWEDRGKGSHAADGAASGTLDLDAFDSADELEMLGGVCCYCNTLFAALLMPL